MEESRKTIKKLYDQYKPQDFTFGMPGSDNLNPTREILLDTLDKVEKKIQEVTDSIVIKKLQPKQEAEEPITGSRMENPGNSIAGKMNAIKAGSSNSVFESTLPPEYASQLQEALAMLNNIDELAKPLVIECDEILQKYSFDIPDSEELVMDDGLPCQVINTAEKSSDDDSSDDDSSDDEDEDEDEDEDDDCAMIELAWLKIILIICNVIKIIKIIIEYVLSILAQILQIICLAVGAWINPPNVAQIVGIIMAIVMSIIAKIIAYLLKMIFDLLNLDCLSDMTIDMIDQIIEALTSFNSLLGMLDSKTVGLLGGIDLNESLNSAKALIRELLEAKKEAWEEAKEELKKQFDEEHMEQWKDEAINTAINSALSTLSEYVDYNKIEQQVETVIEQGEEAWEQMKRINDDVRDAKIKAQKQSIKFSATAGSPDPSFSMLQKGFFVGAQLG